MLAAEGAAMEPIAWDDRWLLGDPRIDQEHRDLVDLVNQVAELLGRGAAPRDHRDLLDRLDLDLAEHCRHERELMRRTLCPSTAPHERQHRQIADALTAFRDAWEGGIPGFLDGFATFRDGFLYHQNTGLDAELARHCRQSGLLGR